VAPKPKSWFLRQKVLGTNIHETEGLLERSVADATRNLNIFGDMCHLVCVYVCVGVCVCLVDTVSLYRSKCTCVFVCQGVRVFVCVCVLTARNFCACA